MTQRETQIRIIRVLILCHVSRFILLIIQFKSEIEIQFCSIFTMLTLRSPPLLEICVLHSIVVLFFWLNKTFCFSLNIRHAYLQVHLPSAKANNDNNTNLFTFLISNIKSYSGNDPLLPWPQYASLSLSLSLCG